MINYIKKGLHWIGGDKLNKLLEEALLYEQKNDLHASEQCYIKALTEYPNEKDILCCFGIFLFKKGDYVNALDCFVKSYSHPDQTETTKKDLLDHILISYYQPYERTLKDNYDNNVNALLGYEHNHIQSFMEFNTIPCLCIPRTDYEYYIWDKNTKQFTERIVLEKAMISYTDVSINDCVIGTDIFDCMKLQSLAQQTKDPTWLDNIKKPIYLIWQDRVKIHQYLQLDNYEKIIEINRFVLFLNYDKKSGIREFLEDHQAYIPNKAVGDDQYFKQIIEIINHAQMKREKDISKKIMLINQMAQKYDKKYYKRIFSGGFEELRILFYTSRFTQVVQYGTKDFMRACEKIGIKCHIVIEKSEIHQASNLELVSEIAEFKPNIIFRINFFKPDFKIIPKNIMFITWLQDPVYQITSHEHGKNFCWNDFALIQTENWLKKMISAGYDSKRIAVQPVPIDENIFCVKNISSKEKIFYTADISFPGNYQRPEKDLANIIIRYTDGITNSEVKNRIINMLVSTYDILKTRIVNDELIYNSEQCQAVIIELARILEIRIEEDVIKKIAQEFFHPVCYNLYRKITIKWLIDSGFQVKLWGSGWDADPDFKENAMGALAHGEELAKMYSCTKIVLGAFFEYTAHIRSWESTACEALCMVRYIPSEFDLVDIREYFTENKHFIFYRDKQDLIDKVKYYLVNEDERKRIVANGKEKVLEIMTYSSAVYKCLSLIKENIDNK